MTENVYKLTKPLIVTDGHAKDMKISENGIYADELWNLDYTLAYFMLPRVSINHENYT